MMSSSLSSLFPSNSVFSVLCDTCINKPPGNGPRCNDCQIKASIKHDQIIEDQKKQPDDNAQRGIRQARSFTIGRTQEDLDNNRVHVSGSIPNTRWFCVNCNIDSSKLMCSSCGAFCACKRCGAICDCV
jgi:hypothetical protein